MNIGHQLTCDICVSVFDEDSRRPKVLPCGHTFCLTCLKKRPKDICPHDGKESSGAAKDLPDNCFILKLLSNLNANRFWCVQCSAAPSPGCDAAGHLLQAASYRRQRAERLQQLRRLEEPLQAEQELLQALQQGLQHDLERCAQRLQELRDCAEGLQAQLPAQTCLQEAERLLRGAQGSKPIDEDERMTVSGATWRAEAVLLREWPAFQLGVLQLQREGLLQEQQGEEGKQEPPAPRTEEDLLNLSRSRAGLRTEEKAALLQREVHVIRNMNCSLDSAWAMQLLVSQVPTLQDLHLIDVSREQLLELQRMPWAQLRRLQLSSCNRDLKENPTIPELWEGSGLQGLIVTDMPEQTQQTLLRSHRRTLEELRLCNPSRQQLLELQRTPWSRLRKLQIYYRGCITDFEENPWVPEQWVGPKLQWLVVGSMPTATLSALLRLHCPSLEELQLYGVSAQLLQELLPLPWSRLRKLELSMSDKHLQEGPAIPELWKGPGLRWLNVSHMPNKTLHALLRLQRHSLEELLFTFHPVSREDLLELQRIPWSRLRRLELGWSRADFEEDPPIPELWAGPGLRRLWVGKFPKRTLQALLRPHRHSLEALELCVGTPPPAGSAEEWPDTCGDLPALLAGLTQLRTLALRRVREHRDCPAQLAALRGALPGCTVTCNKD